MNTIQVSNCKVMEYSNANPVGFIKDKNEYGEFVCFRIYEKRYKKRPIPRLCIANGGLAEKIEKMKLKPGDSVVVGGEEELYFDKERNRDAYRIIVTNIDYNYDSMKKTKENDTDSEQKREESTSKTPLDDSSSIDLSKCDIFQQEIN